MEKISPIFGESITTEKIRRKGNSRFSFGDGSSQGFKFYLIPLILFAIGGLFILRIVFLQIIQGSYFRSLSDSNRTKTQIVHAPRGIIFDRNGKPLTYNVPGFREIVDGKTKLIGKDEAIALIAKGAKNLEIDSLRSYPGKESSAHLLGYIGQISEEELKLSKYSNYKSGDVIGKIGIESEYEGFLKGEDGKELIEVDSMGKTLRKLGKTDPVPGRNIALTIDKKLQEKSYLAMRDIKKGAVIATNPKGEILALVSKPSFDTNLFTQGNDYKTTDSKYPTIDSILSDSKNQPFLNRVISGVYPPGSTFKIVVAAAGLGTGAIDTNYIVEDSGIINVGAFSFANWYYTDYGGKDGEVNVIKGIKRSNDIFFYKLAEKIGVDRLSAVAKKFGLGKVLGIDLAGEVKGLVPTREWKEKVIGEPWYLGDTYIYGIGQGYLLTTPLQVNSLTQVIANAGSAYRPYLFKDLGDKKIVQDLIDKKTTDVITQGMVESCEPSGVAWPLFDFKVKNSKLKIDGRNILEVPISSGSADMRKVVIACKTGTAQHGGESTAPHAWITLFAPAYNPQIILTVLAEESGQGSNVAAPIAKQILETWFGGR